MWAIPRQKYSRSVGVGVRVQQGGGSEEGDRRSLLVGSGASHTAQQPGRGPHGLHSTKVC